MSGNKPAGPLVWRYQLSKSFRRHVPALGVGAPALSEELGSSDFFYSLDGIGGKEKADRKKEENEEERKAEVGFCSKRYSSSFGIADRPLLPSDRELH